MICFSLKFPFVPQISDQNFWLEFLTKIFDQNFWPEFLTKIFDQNFWPKFRFLTKISIFEQSKVSIFEEFLTKNALFRPNWEEVSLLYKTKWNWKNNFTVHLFSRFMPYVDSPVDRTIDELRRLNTTYGEIARFILYNNASLQTLP